MPQASRTLTPPMLIEPGTASTSSGLDRPSSMTAAAVTILFTDPGSKAGHREIADLAVTLTADVLTGVEGVVVGHCQHLAGLGVKHDRRDVMRTERFLAS